MGKYRVEYLPLAYDDLDEIFTYIAADSLEVAVSFLDDIDAAILRLEEFPEMGANPNNRRLSNKGYKMLIVNDYLVFYVVTGEIIEIRRIVSGKRSYTNLL